MTYVKVKNKKIEVYAINGEKGVGKDTFAKYVQEYNKSFSIIRFADDLKDMASKIFNFPREDMEVFEAKERLFKTPIEMDKYLDAMRFHTGLNLKPAKLKAHSLREILQFFGSDYVRASCDSYWVDRVLAKISRLKNKVLVTDCRFPNEAAAIKSINGTIIKIVRVDAVESGDLHQSETAGKSIIPDYTLGTVTGKYYLQKFAASLIANNKASGMHRLDYRLQLKMIDLYKSGAAISDCSKLLGMNRKEYKIAASLLGYYGVKSNGIYRSPGRKPHLIIKGVEHKVCSRCKKPKKLLEFSAQTKNWDLLSPHCKVCRNSSDSYKKYAVVDNVEKIFKNSKKNAKQRGINFTISFNDVENLIKKQNNKCFYSNEVMTTSVNDLKKLTFDRVDSSKGYVKNNVVLCCYVVNIMKGKLAYKDFRLWINKIHTKLERQK